MQLNFDARRVAPSTAPEPVETGTYPVVIKAAQEKPTRANDGTLVELTLEVLHGPAQGKRIIDRLNLGNKNPQAVEIAYGQLSAICHVTGRMQIQSEQQLVGATMQVYVVKEPRADAPGQFGNAVKGYKDMQGNDPGQAGNHGNMQQGGGQMQGQNFGGAQQGQGFDPNANQAGGYGNQGQNNGFDPNAQGGGYGNQNGGGNFGGGQQQNNGGGYNPNQGGGFDPNANGQGGGYNPNQNQGGGYNPNQGGGGYNPNQGGNGGGGPAGNGNAPSWA